METNNIVAAPEMDQVTEFYEIWKRNHLGSMDVFYRFMTTATPEREEFLNSLHTDMTHTFNRGVLETILTKNK